MNTNESGRSMVEMLGVLAIIGVLSIGGIAGYTQAMKKYRTNEAVNTIAMAAVMCAARTSSSQSVTLPTSDYVEVECNGTNGATWTATSPVKTEDISAMIGASPYNVVS